MALSTGHAYRKYWLHVFCSKAHLADVEQVGSETAVEVVGPAQADGSVPPVQRQSKQDLKPSMETMITVLLNAWVPLVLNSSLGIERRR